MDEAIDEILNFYSNYHSGRYRGEKLYLRVRQLPDAEQLAALNDDYAGLLTRGKIDTLESDTVNAGEVRQLPCVVLRFNRRDAGHLRRLIDTLNSYVPDAASPPREASRPEIVPSELSSEAEAAEWEE